MCVDKVDKLLGDGPLNRMRELMDKNKATAPDDWRGGFDWDKKPVPPEDFYNERLDESEEDPEGSKKSQPK